MTQFSWLYSPLKVRTSNVQQKAESWIPILVSLDMKWAQLAEDAITLMHHSVTWLFLDIIDKCNMHDDKHSCRNKSLSQPQPYIRSLVMPHPDHGIKAALLKCLSIMIINFWLPKDSRLLWCNKALFLLVHEIMMQAIIHHYILCDINISLYRRRQQHHNFITCGINP